MNHDRFDRYVERIRAKLHSAFAEEHTPKEVAGSFALGTFITMLPTLGTGLLLFVVIVAVSEQVSKLAMFASVLVFNPIMKWGVYVASFALGTFLLGPVEGVSMADISLGAGPEIVARLLLGNLILAIVAAVVSFPVVHRLAVRYSSTAIVETIDEALEELAEDVLEP